MKINEYIKSVRQDRGLTQSDLADMMGVSQPYIAELERTGRMQLVTLEKLSDVLKFDIEFFKRVDSSKVTPDFISKSLIWIFDDINTYTAITPVGEYKLIKYTTKYEALFNGEIFNTNDNLLDIYAMKDECQVHFEKIVKQLVKPNLL